MCTNASVTLFSYLGSRKYHKIVISEGDVAVNPKEIKGFHDVL